MPKGWSHKREQFKKCSKEKQKKISKVLSSLSKILTNVGELKIYCATKSETPMNPATSAPDHKIITLYDSSKSVTYLPQKKESSKAWPNTSHNSL